MSQRQRRPIAAGNWKMNLLRRDAEAFCRDLRGAFAEPAACEIVLFPSATLLTTVAAELKGSGVAIGGQDLHPAASGAHTGDVSGLQLADAGCGWVLCGHSERRQDHGEDDALVARKARAATDHGLLPMICLGESRDERRELLDGRGSIDVQNFFLEQSTQAEEWRAPGSQLQAPSL